MKLYEQDIINLFENSLNTATVDIDVFCDKYLDAYKSLFPNNYMKYNYLKSDDLRDEFLDLIKHKKATEMQISGWIKRNRAWGFISGVIGHKFWTGHHGTYLFPEFPLCNSYKVDYLVVGKNSDGYQFFFVELESPNKAIVIKRGGEFGESIRKGINQVINWESWINCNFRNLESVFRGYMKNKGDSLPYEFSNYEPWRFHYIVVSGLRKDYEKIRNNKGLLALKSNIHLLHYENLFDWSQDLSKSIREGQCR